MGNCLQLSYAITSRSHSIGVIQRRQMAQVEVRVQIVLNSAKPLHTIGNDGSN